MSRIYISYAPEDVDNARRLVDWLGGDDAVAGLALDDADLEVWRAELAQADVLLVVVGRHGLSTSQRVLLQIVETEMVIPATTRIVPVLLPGAVRESRAVTPFLLNRSDWISIPSDDDAKGRELLVGMIYPDRRRPSSKVPEGQPDNPFRGLSAFDEGDAADYYGREALTHSLLADLRREMLMPGGTRFLAIIGPSGSGKSSLARAGILASIQRGQLLADGRPMVCATLRPGADPLESLAIAICSVTQSMTAANVRELARELAEDDLALHYRLRASGLSTCILVDQFEELFSLTTDETRRTSFIGNILAAALAPDSNALVLITMRADFYSHIANYPRLAYQVSNRQVLVGPMTDAELRRAIEEPVSRRGRTFEHGLVERLIADVRTRPAALPLLQFALTQLWARTAGNVLTHATYDAIGGVGGALSRHAENIFEALSESQKDICRQILLRLVQPGERTEDTRRRVDVRELDLARHSRQAVQEVVDYLVGSRARLILISGVGDQSPTVEVAHEALLTNWPRFVQWIDDERETLLFRRSLSASAIEWESKSRAGDYLLSGPALLRAVQWYEDHKDAVNRIEGLYLLASVSSAIAETLKGSDEDLRARLVLVRELGSLVDDAVKSLQYDASVPSEVRRRALLLLQHPPQAAIDALMDSTRSVGPEEFLVVLEEIRLHFSRPALEDIWDALSARSAKGDERFRTYLSLCVLAPDDPRWASAVHSFADDLVNQDSMRARQWIGPISYLAGLIQPVLVDLAVSSVESDERRVCATHMALALPGADGKTLGRLASGCPDSVTADVDSAAAVNPSIHDAVVRYLEHAVGTHMVPHDSGMDPRLVGGSLASLCRLNSTDKAASLLGLDSICECVYQFARRFGQRGPDVATIIHLAAEHESLVAVFGLLLAASTHRPDGPVSARHRTWLVETFQTNPNSDVHSAAGLLIERWLGREARENAEVEIAGSGLRNGAGWMVTTVTGRPLTMILVPPGSYEMGSPLTEAGRTRAESPHHVAISKPFLLADRTISRGEYETYVRQSGGTLYSQELDEWSPTTDHPIVSQTWQEASDYAHGITARQSGESGRLQFRLPTEAEWEYACRATSTTAYSFGDDSSLLDYCGWYLATCPDRRTRPSRVLWPNPLGLFDMHGNVYEWCHDWYGPYDSLLTNDPSGPTTGPGKVLRGGGYNYSAQDCRSAYRYFTEATNRNARIGFRLAGSLE